MWDPQPSRRDPDEGWDTTWDPAQDGEPGSGRYQPNSRAKTIIVLTAVVATVATMILLCVAGVYFVRLWTQALPT